MLRQLVSVSSSGYEVLHERYSYTDANRMDCVGPCYAKDSESPIEPLLRQDSERILDEVGKRYAGCGWWYDYRFNLIFHWSSQAVHRRGRFALIAGRFRATHYTKSYRHNQVKTGAICTSTCVRQVAHCVRGFEKQWVPRNEQEGPWVRVRQVGRDYFWL